MLKNFFFLFLIFIVCFQFSCRDTDNTQNNQKLKVENGGNTKPTEINENLGQLSKAVTLQRKIVGFQEHVYEFKLNKNEFVNVSVVGSNINVSISLSERKSGNIIEIDDSYSLKGKEILALW